MADSDASPLSGSGMGMTRRSASVAAPRARRQTGGSSASIVAWSTDDACAASTGPKWSFVTTSDRLSLLLLLLLLPWLLLPAPMACAAASQMIFTSTASTAAVEVVCVAYFRRPCAKDV